MIYSITKLTVSPEETTVGIVLIVLMLIFVVLACSMPWIRWFKQELKYINSEIERNEGREKERWIRRKKRLLKSIIPFVKYE